MQSLFLAAIADVRERGGKAIEAFGYRYAEGESIEQRVLHPPNGLPERLSRRLRIPERAAPRPRRAGTPGARRSRHGRGEGAREASPARARGARAEVAGAGSASSVGISGGMRPARDVALRRDETEPPELSRQHDSIDVIVLAGGRGTRLAPYTTVLPKPLTPMGRCPSSRSCSATRAAASGGATLRWGTWRG